MQPPRPARRVYSSGERPAPSARRKLIAAQVVPATPPKRLSRDDEVIAHCRRVESSVCAGDRPPTWISSPPAPESLSRLPAFTATGSCAISTHLPATLPGPSSHVPP